MTKQTPKNNQTKVNYLTLTIASIALVLSLVSVCAIWQTDQNTRLWTESDFKNTMENNKRQARFEFCFNNNVRPCDDISLKEFNDRPENKASGNLFSL